MAATYKALYLLTLALATAKADFNFAYGATSFVAYNAANGVNVAKNAYKSCIEKTNDGSMTSTGALCVFDCTQYVFSAVGSVLGGGYGVSIVQDGVGGAQQSLSPDPPGGKGSSKSRSTYDQALLEAFNARMKALQNETAYLAEAIVPSQVHPYDGLAYRFNLRDEANNYFHLHTNGSHAMALFHPADQATNNRTTNNQTTNKQTTNKQTTNNQTTNNQTTITARQSFLDTGGHYYTFTGLDGLKIEWHNINHDPDGSSDDSHFLSPWVRSDLKKAPIMSTSDVWDFQACNTKKTATFYYGRLVFELNRPGFNYENITPRGC